MRMSNPDPRFRGRRVLACASALLIVVVGCDGGGESGSPTAPPPPVPTGSETAAAELAGASTAVAIAAAKAAYAAAVLLTQSSSAAGGYDPGTGWWTISVTLDTGAAASLSLQLRNASGGHQAHYDPATTHEIEIRGDAADCCGRAALALDFVLTGTENSASRLTINGDADAVASAARGWLSVSGLVLAKSLGAYPEGGQVAFGANTGQTIQIRFNGTQFATGTYTANGLTVSFTIDLRTGQITWG